jgi:hypothetical protein
MSVRPPVSVRPSVLMEQLGSHWADFHEILYMITFRKFIEKIQVSLKSDKNNGTVLYKTPDIHLCIYVWSYLAQFLEWEMFQTKVVQ